MSARLTDSLNVLAGEVSDGLGVTSLAVLINRPDGATDWQALDLTAAPTWQFTLYSVSAGDDGLTLARSLAHRDLWHADLHRV